MRKISRGASFRGVLDYAFEREPGSELEHGRLIDSNMAGTNARQLASEFGQVRAQRQDIEKPVWHNSLRLPAGERIDDQSWAEISRDYVGRMGLDPDRHQYAVVLHDDAEGQHVHIIANRVAIDGSVYLGKNENLASTRHIAALEKQYGLRITKGVEYTMDGKVAMPAKQQIKKGEVEMALRTNEQPPRLQLQSVIKGVLADKPTPQQFIERLETAGVTAMPNIASTGRMNGFSFEINGVAFKASQLGDDYKWKSLERSMDYVQDRDSTYLAEHSKRLARAIPAAERAAAEPGLEQASGPARESDAALGRVDGRPEPGGPLSNQERGEAADRSLGQDARSSRSGLSQRNRAEAADPGRTEGGQPGSVGGRASEEGRGKLDHHDVRSRDRVRGAVSAIGDLAAPAAAAANRAGPGSDRTAARTVSADEKVKRQAWAKQSAALDAPHYRITLVGRRPGQPEGWNMGKGKGKDGAEQFYTREQVADMIPALRRQNARGFDIYITPISKQHHYVLIDDMKPGALGQLKSDGYQPCLVQQSSQGNRQAIVRVMKHGREDEQQIVNKVVQDLNQRYGDPKLSGVVHPFRMAGFSNKKANRLDMFTQVLEGSSVTCKKTQQDRAKRAEKADAAIIAKLQVERINKLNRDRVETLSQEKYGSDYYGQVYRHTAGQLEKVFGPQSDWSRIDYRATCEMLKRGANRAEVEHALRDNSPNLTERHADAGSYVTRTIAAAEREPSVASRMQEIQAERAAEAERQAQRRAQQRGMGLSR